MSSQGAKFQNRAEAGKALATRLRHYAEASNTIVIGLPRGGVPVAYEVASALNLPLDILLVRKLGVPRQPELAMGAIASYGVQVLNHELIQRLGISQATIDQVTDQELQELYRRDRAYRSNAPPLDLHGKIVILVDDGLATGSTLRAAIATLKPQHPARIIVAVPVAQAEVYQALKSEVHEIICLLIPQDFYAVGQWYVDFSQTSDAEVKSLLARTNLHPHTP